MAKVEARGDGEPGEPTAPASRRFRDHAGRLCDELVARLTVDTRALAVVRILLGSVLLLDLAHRAQDLTRYYTDQGVFPTAAYHAWDPADLSIHAISGEVWFQALLFIIAAVIALAFTLGYRARLMGAASLVLLLSLQDRNPFVLNGGDQLLGVLLLISLATPIGERWSIDALGRGPGRPQVATFGTAALLLQPVVVFTSNAILKHRGDMWFAGEALARALGNEPLTTGIGHALASQTLLLTVLNYGWVGLLTGSAFFLLAPTGRLRAVVALAYTSAFAGMALTMTVGWFPLLLTAAVVPFLTAPFWDAVERALPSVPTVAGRQAPATGPPRRWHPSGDQRRSQDPAAEGPTPVPAPWTHWASRTFGVLLLVWMLLFSTTHVTALEPPGPIDVAYLDKQDWGLFAPNPPGSYGWYVIEAELAGGTNPSTRTLDPLDLGPVSGTPDGFDTFRDRKFMQAVWSSSRDEPSFVAETYAAWACDQANIALADAVDRITVYRINHIISDEDLPHDPRRIVTIERSCTGP